MASCLSLVSMYGSYLHYCLSSAGLSSQTIQIDNETTIHLWAPTTSTVLNPKRPLVLIHGFGPQGVWQWRQQIAFLSREFDLYIPDLVFFGNSTTKSNERSEVFQATCIVKVLETFDISKYSIIGTSYGGFVAYHMSLNWPERVEKVVIASSGINLRKKDNELLLKRGGVENIEELMLPRTARQLRALIGLSVYKRPYMPDFFLNDFIDKLYSEYRVEKLELLKGLTLGRNDTVNISPLLQEVLIVWGDNDLIFPLEKATELKELLGEKARLEVIKNASHIPQIENAKQFNNIVKRFLFEI